MSTSSVRDSSAYHAAKLDLWHACCSCQRIVLKLCEFMNSVGVHLRRTWAFDSSTYITAGLSMAGRRAGSLPEPLVMNRIDVAAVVTKE